MMKKFAILLLFAGIAAGLSAREGDTLYFSLEEARDYAVANNLNAENSRMDVEIADKRVWETAAGGLPQVDASMSYNYNIDLATTLIPDFLNNPQEKIEVQFGTKHYATAGITANQLIFSGSYFVGLQTSRIYKEFSKRNQEKTEQDIQETVIQNYYLVLLSQHTLEALRGNLENTRKIYSDTRELYKTGFTDEIDVDQLAVTVTTLENSVRSMERQVEATRNLLKYQMGLERNKTIVLTDELQEMVSMVDFESVLTREFNVSQNVDYQLLSRQEELAFMDLKLKRTEFMPNLSAFYSLDFTAQRDEFSFFDQDKEWYQASMLGLSLNVPILSSGARIMGLSQKRIEYEKAKNNKQFAAEGLQVEFMQARYDLANALETYRSEKKNLEVAGKVVDKTREKYREGVASSLELTQVNDQYLQTLSSYTSAMVEVLNAKITMDILLNNI